MKIDFPENYAKPILIGKKEFTLALRSGVYPQFQGKLCSTQGYCCLGVWSKINGRMIKEDGRWCDGVKNKYLYLQDDSPLGSNGQFPEGYYIRRERRTFTDLAALNDAGFTFAEIADIIDQVWD